MDEHLLRYRRQFLLGSEPVEGFPGWQAARLRGGYHLSAHPELGLCQLRSGECELTLLGYLIDPRHPEWGDAEILETLLAQAGDFPALLKATHGLSGRWLIFYWDGAQLYAFHDPCGLRSLYYTGQQGEPFLCASQPGLIAATRGLRYSEQAQRDYLETKAYRELVEYWLPGGASLYDEIAQLMPNHFLDVRARKAERFWPWAALEPVDLAVGAQRAGALLEGLLSAAQRRFPLALPLTAGIDSRVLLAASRTMRAQVYYYTLAYYGADQNDPDIAVPGRLLCSLGLEHHVLDCHAPMDGEFKRIYMGNVDLAHPVWGDIAFGLYNQYPQERVALKGNCSEIARCFYHRYEYPARLDAARLAAFAKMADSPFAARHFGRWLEAALPATQQSRVDVLDLFYWEHRMGSWQAISQLEWDIVQEPFTPFNCRELLSLMLGVDERYRKPPGYALHREIIRNLWPEALNEPINPKPLQAKLKKDIPHRLRASALFQAARRARKKLFKKSSQ